MTESFEIMFDDLSDDAKCRFLEFMRLRSINDSNYGIFPIATVEVEIEVLKENEKEVKAQRREKERKRKREERKKREANSFT